jgi:hypothetical protein
MPGSFASPAWRALKFFAGFAIFAIACKVLKHALNGDLASQTFDDWRWVFIVSCAGSAVIGLVAFWHFKRTDPKTG